MARAARDHCNDIGPKGQISHIGSDGSQPWERIERYAEWDGSVAENISFGQDTGADLILNLYIDDGVTNRGHRTNMINKELTMTGIAACSHNS